MQTYLLFKRPQTLSAAAILAELHKCFDENEVQVHLENGGGVVQIRDFAYALIYVDLPAPLPPTASDYHHQAHLIISPLTPVNNIREAVGPNLEQMRLTYFIATLIEPVGVYWADSERIADMEGFTKALGSYLSIRKGSSEPISGLLPLKYWLSVDEIEPLVYQINGMKVVGEENIILRFNEKSIVDKDGIISSLIFYIFDNGITLQKGNSVELGGYKSMVVEAGFYLEIIF